MKPARATAQNERLYAGLSAEQRRAERRERLILSALELYGTAGYRHTTIPQLCSGAGVTARHFYEDFASQEALLAAIYDRIANEMLVQIGSALDRKPERQPAETYHDAAEAFFAFMMKDVRRARIYALEVIGVGPTLDRRRQAMRNRFAALAVSHSERQGFEGDEADVRLLTLALSGVTDALLTDWLTSKRRPSVRTMVDLTAVVWTRTFQQRTAGKLLARSA